MNAHAYLYIHLRHRHQLPALRREVGKVDRDIDTAARCIAIYTTQREFAPLTGGTRSRPSRAACDLMLAAARADVRELHLKRERLLSAIDQLNERHEAPRRLSLEARRAIAELPGTRPEVLSAGQSALVKCLSLTGKRRRKLAA